MPHLEGLTEDRIRSRSKRVKNFLHYGRQPQKSFRDKWLLVAKNHQVPVLCDHGVAEHNVLARLSPEDFEGFVEVVSEFAALARQAFNSTDPAESGRLWQQIFGSRFPLPGPSGGDRPVGHFVKPTVAAVPPTSDRFA